MKRQIITWGMMLAAAFTLTNCAKEIENPNEQPEKTGYPFEIVASTVDTKTANDGVSTVWVAEDQINLFHAVCDGKDYKDDGPFTINVVEEGRFTGELSETLDPQEEYDWYAFYPYKSQITSPVNTSGWAYIGNRKGVSQTGYDNKEHLSGTNCPLYGIATDVPAASTPSIVMNHLSSVVAIKVTNNTDADLTINNAILTANEPIVGSFYIDFSDTPTYDISGADYVSSEAKVNVSGGTALAKGESATLYLVVKPFIAAKDSKLSISVNGYEKSLTMPSDVTFHAGKIKTLNFSYDKESSSTIVTWDLTKNSYSSSSEDEVEWTSNHVDLLLQKNASTTNANNYLGGTNAHTRVYKNQIMTFTPSVSFVIEKIEFVATSSDYATKFQKATWLNANVVTSSSIITVTPVNGYTPIAVTIGDATRFTSITVYGSYDEDYVPPTLESIAVSNPTTEFRQNDDFAFGGVVTATYSDESSSVVTAAATFSGYDLTKVGTQTVTVTYTEGEVTVTTTYEIEVEAVQTEPTSLVSATIDGFIKSDVSETMWYKLEGEIIDIASSTYGNFTIKDGTGQVYIYGMTNGWIGENDKSFANIGLKVGDVVTLGTLRGEYNNTPQGGGNDYPAYYISHVSCCAAPIITCTENTVTIKAEEGATIYYTTDGTEPTTSSTTYSEPFPISETTTVKAIAVAEGKLQSAVASKSCTYDDPNAGGGEGTTVTTNIGDYASNNSWTNGTKYTTINIDDNITATAAGTDSNTGKYYTSGTNWRLYQTGAATLTISAAEGYTINSVKITYTVDKKGVLTLNGSNISSDDTVNVNASSITFGVGNTSTATNGQVRVTGIEVVYQAN